MEEGEEEEEEQQRRRRRRREGKICLTTIPKSYIEQRKTLQNEVVSSPTFYRYGTWGIKVPTPALRQWSVNNRNHRYSKRLGKKENYYQNWPTQLTTHHFASAFYWVAFCSPLLMSRWRTEWDNKNESQKCRMEMGKASKCHRKKKKKNKVLIIKKKWHYW